MKKQNTSRIASLVAATAIMMVGSSSTWAALVNVDQIIAQGATGLDVNQLSGTVDMSVSGNQLTILLRNTTGAGAVGAGFSSPATLLLTGVGFQLSGVTITGGTVSINAGSSAVNFGAVDLSTEWGYANQAVDGYNGIPSIPVNAVVSSMEQGGAQTKFSGNANIDGPGYGAISAALLAAFGNSQPGVNDTIKLVLTLSGAVNVADIDAGNVVLAFGSPTLAVPEPSTYLAAALLLLPFGASTIRILRKNRAA